VTLPRRFGMLSAMHVRGRLAECLVTLLGFAAVGCTGGTETGNPTLTGQLSYSDVSSSSEVGVRMGGSVATVQNAWFALDPVTVSSDGSCGVEGDHTFSVAALGIGDHASGAHVVTEFEATAGPFCSVEVPFARVAADDEAAPSELRGHAVVIDGVLGDGTPFVIESDQAPLVRLQAAESGFSLSTQEPNALIAFDFATWLQGVDWATASVDAGTVVVSETANIELLQHFEASLASGVALYRDAGGDGVLDQSPELLAGAP